MSRHRPRLAPGRSVPARGLLQACEQVVRRRDIAEIDAEVDQRSVVLFVVVIGVRVADHGGAEVEQHGVARGALAAGIGRGAADPDRSDASVAKFGLDRRRALDEGAVACLADDQVFRADVESGESFEPNAPSFIASWRRALRCGVLRLLWKCDQFLNESSFDTVRTQTESAGLAERVGQPVDVRDDLARRGDFHLLAPRHEIVLHIDDHEGGLTGRHVVVDIPAALPGETRATTFSGI